MYYGRVASLLSVSFSATAAPTYLTFVDHLHSFTIPNTGVVDADEIMPSASATNGGKAEKVASSEATETPIRQVVTILEHKIRNLEKRKSKLISYRDLQKSGKDLNADQKVAVAKYDEVAQTLEFARDLSKQVTSIVLTAEREAKKQAKKEAYLKNATETGKIREVLLILDCLMQMGSPEARDDFLNGSNGAVKLAEEDLKILDDLYPEVTPKHEVNEEGIPGFHGYATKAAEHLYCIIDGKSKEVLGTTYAHIKQIVSIVHDCGYFDKQSEGCEAEVEAQEATAAAPEPAAAPCEREPPYMLPVPPAPAVVPAPAYPLCPLPPITLQEVEHAYFAQQYPQQRPISEVIGSQNFFFLQESEIDSPAGTLQPPPASIPTQTFTNQHYVQLPGARVAPDPGALPIPQPHFAPPPSELATYAPLPAPAHPAAPAHAHPPAAAHPPPHAADHTPHPPHDEDVHDDEWKESRSPECDEGQDRARGHTTQGQGDGQGRYRRYPRGSGSGRGAPNGYRGRGGYGYHQGRNNEYQRYNNDGYQNRQNRNSDGYYGNGDTGNGHQQGDSYQGGFKGRGRGGARGSARGAPRPTRPARAHYNRKNDPE